MSFFHKKNVTKFMGHHAVMPFGPVTNILLAPLALFQALMSSGSHIINNDLPSNPDKNRQNHIPPNINIKTKRESKLSKCKNFGQFNSYY